MYMDLQRRIKSYKISITVKKLDKRIIGVVNAPNDYAVRQYLEQFGFNSDNSIIAIS